ncbi:30S ribosomal protein S8 [Candidatus Woesearchaeota archaeon]|jgi:small subunit ribosomal protein S8|nr:30S ribosomal protein S8 [Candidatus Woesearchaeota archaeon]MBT4114763.1 30S ribosomal protein S8 [Candidatus Woesearchaeota archaeon]MBT4248136.1 30S ribosomal protein S8 [Candidatus Woesearchaeota archaeon]
MVTTDNLANVLSAIKNAEAAGKNELTVRPSSKVIVAVLDIMKKEKYIADFDARKDLRGGTIVVKLAKQINNTGVIKPRFSVTLDKLEKFEKRYLPAKDFGRIILTTSKGIMTHLEAKENKLGGVLLAYIY